MNEKIPRSLDEAYELRDAASSHEVWSFYQKHVYRLRAEDYLSRGIVTKGAVRRRELWGTVTRRSNVPRSRGERWSEFSRLCKLVFD